MKRLLVALVPLLLVTACGQTEPDPTPVPTTPTVSVSAPSPSATSEDELYAEAERVFRRMLEINDRFEMYGDFSGFPAEMNEVAMGAFLADSQAMYEFLADKQWHGDPARRSTMRSEPAPGLSYEDSIAALHTCNDGSDSPLIGPDGSVVSEGRIVEARVFFKYDTDGRLKIFAQQYREVEQCPASLS